MSSNHPGSDYNTGAANREAPLPVTPAEPDRRLSIAPMMDWTTRHCRRFLRLITHHALLYTEMVTTGALLHGDVPRFLAFDPAEQPLALQVGGSDPGELAACARLAEAWGFVEINLNCGCPSDRVQSGRFGACLMAEPALVADCVAAMRGACSLPVTVKTRLGIDDLDSDELLHAFIARVAAGGCDTFILHARKAWLQGLSPKENRELPPLQYERVYRVKTAFPDLRIVINGGFRSIDDAAAALQLVDGVMIGRAAYQDPWCLASADQRLFNAPPAAASRHGVVEAYLPYVHRMAAAGVPMGALCRHLLGLYHGQPGARAWRRHLSEHMHRPGAAPAVLEQALADIAAVAA